MLNDWFLPLELKLTWEEFQTLPRHPAYRYEYLNGVAIVTGNPRYHHAVLDLNVCKEFSLTSSAQPLSSTDAPQLVELFSRAFARSLPLDCLSKEQSNECANQLLLRTFEGADGPVVEAASFTIRNDADLISATIIITLLPCDDFEHFEPANWNVTAPVDAVGQCWGVPHLTWVFVEPKQSRRGIGQALLKQSVSALRILGYNQLFSTLLLGNHTAMLWHWKMGFRLI